MTDTDDERIMTLLRNAPPDTPEGDHVDDGRLVAYRDGALEASLTDEVEAHLATCRDCRELLDELASPVDEVMFARARNAARPAARRWGRAVAVAIAMAAAVIAAFLLPRGTELPPYALEGPFGGLTEVRGPAEASGVFVPASRVKVLLRPDRPTDASALAVFVVQPDGALARAPDSGVTRGEGGGFRVEYTASDLFATGFGERTLQLVLSGRAVDAAGEISTDELKRRVPDGRWFAVTVDYRERRGSE